MQVLQFCTLSMYFYRAYKSTRLHEYIIYRVTRGIGHPFFRSASKWWGIPSRKCSLSSAAFKTKTMSQLCPSLCVNIWGNIGILSSILASTTPLVLGFQDTSWYKQRSFRSFQGLMIFKTFSPTFPLGLLQRTFPSWKVHWMWIVSRDFQITFQQRRFPAAILKKRNENKAAHLSFERIQ